MKRFGSLIKRYYSWTFDRSLSEGATMQARLALLCAIMGLILFVYYWFISGVFYIISKLLG